MKYDIAPAFQFFYQLPTLRTPKPQVENPSQTAMYIIPIFTDAYFSAHSLVAYLKAAIYARQTCLLHTDAYQTESAVKLYIKDILEPDAVPILETNGLNPETDVLWFSAPRSLTQKMSLVQSWNLMRRLPSVLSVCPHPIRHRVRGLQADRDGWLLLECAPSLVMPYRARVPSDHTVG